MASYPNSLPAIPDAGAQLSTNPHSDLHDDLRDEVLAIATELGTAPSDVYTNVKDRIGALFALIAPAWVGVTYNSGWVDATTNRGLSYTKIGTIGFLVGGTTRDSGVATVIATLPVGYRPNEPITAAEGAGDSVTLNEDGTIDAPGAGPYYINMVFPVD